MPIKPFFRRYSEGNVSWKIVVEHGNLSFSAAHFITLAGDYEPLHGHNYALHAELSGETMLEDSYLLDFGVAKSILRSLLAPLNHRFLLPLRNPYMDVRHEGAEWEIRLRDGTRYVMPDSSVAALDLDNATAERLAEYFARQLRDELRKRGVTHLTAITVGIGETEMQRAYHTLNFSEGGLTP
jgi:6-pyruvoyl-tetrahydropterin synthase